MARGVMASIVQDAFLAKKIKWVFAVIIGIWMLLYGFFDGMGFLFNGVSWGYRWQLWVFGVMLIIIGVDIRKGA